MATHVEMTEVRVVWDGKASENEPAEIRRPVCRYCWHEGPDGQPRREDWPCPTARARTAVALLNSMVLSGESHSETSRAAVRRAMDDLAARQPAAD